MMRTGGRLALAVGGALLLACPAPRGGTAEVQAPFVLAGCRNYFAKVHGGLQEVGDRYGSDSSRRDGLHPVDRA